MRDFIHAAPATRVIFGSGTIAKLADEARTLGMARALILSTSQQEAQAHLASSHLEGRGAGIFAGAVMHTPTSVTERAFAEAHSLGVDGFISIGGGSTTGLGKALALRTGLPHITIPTTYAGSEMTPILGETADGIKKTVRDVRVLPNTVIYDVDLTLQLPFRMSGVSGLNAIAHAVEALYASDTNPIVQLMAEEGIRALYTGLPLVVAQPNNKDARSNALYGAWLCAACLGQTTMALHHKLCHVLGGSFDLPHAETHAIVLPHALAYNAPAAPDAIARIKRAIGHDAPAIALYELNRAFGAPAALRDLGMPESGVERAVALALKDPYQNPRPLEADSLRQLLMDAWLGVQPD
jgi:alcohol dehydrogenase class IV